MFVQKLCKYVQYMEISKRKDVICKIQTVFYIVIKNVN